MTLGFASGKFLMYRKPKQAAAPGRLQVQCTFSRHAHGARCASASCPSTSLGSLGLLLLRETLCHETCAGHYACTPAEHEHA